MTPENRNRSVRIAVLALALALGLGLPMAAQAGGGGKVDICHIPPGNPANWHTINVSVNAVPAHEGHGDPIVFDVDGDPIDGACWEVCEQLCDDGNACTQDISSNTEECICYGDERPQVNCDDSNECTVNTCNELTGGCESENVVDGVACGEMGSGYTCQSGVCIEPPPSGPTCQEVAEEWSAPVDGFHYQVEGGVDGCFDTCLGIDAGTAPPLPPGGTSSDCPNQRCCLTLFFGEPN